MGKKHMIFFTQATKLKLNKTYKKSKAEKKFSAFDFVQLKFHKSPLIMRLKI